MPFSRFRRRRGFRNFRRSTRFVHKAPAKWIASKSFVKKQIRKQIETKYFDVELSSTGISTAGTITNLSNMAQGTTDLTRVGDKVTLRALRLNTNIVLGDTTNLFRLVVFQWYASNSLVAPVVSDIFPLGYLGSTNTTNAPFVHDYSDQFNVLFDKTYILDIDNPVRTSKLKIPLKFARKTLAFAAGTTASSNAIYALMISDSAAVNHPTISFISRLYFDDA